MRARLEKLRGRLQEATLDALLVSTPENRRYLSGFTGSAGYLLISQEATLLATDFRYVEQAGQQASDFRVVRIGGSFDWSPKLVTELGVKRVGFESQHLTVATYKAMTDALQSGAGNGEASLVATAGLVEQLRSVKEPEEVALIARAVEIADHAFEEVARIVQARDTEQEVAWRLEKAMREAGAEAVSFETIVAAGPNAALPHHRPSERPIGAGEPVVIDMGARYQGYCSDMTRTLCLGPVNETFRKVYDTVLGAQLTAMATIAAGMTAGQADALARQVIERAGYGEYFGHAVGHGIGLAVHEFPRVGPNAEAPLQEGMVFTIEPGIYLPGWGGVRIEDTVILENGKVRSMSKAFKTERPP